MNTDTGKVYDTEAGIAAAQARGENLTPITSKAAKRIMEGRRLLAIAKRKVHVAQERSRERSAAKRGRAKRAQEKASRRANRR